jgi:hypothetical protein
MMISALQHIETERWRRGISLLAPAPIGLFLACLARPKEGTLGTWASESAKAKIPVVSPDLQLL